MVFTANTIKTSLAAVNGGADYALLTGKTEIFAYENGKKISENPVGVKLTIALQNAGLSPLGVKFDHDPLPKISETDIANACSACEFCFVQIPDCIVTLYSSDKGGISMTATATTAKLVTLNNHKE